MLTVTADDIAQACRDAGLARRAACVHVALGSFGWVTGGGAAVVQGMAQARCTMLAPTFSWAAYAIAPPAHLRPARNGWEYGAVSRRNVLGMEHRRVFTPASKVIDAEMGAVPAALLADPKSVRSSHPLCSFAAVGASAAHLLARQRADDVFAPLRALAAQDGFVVLMGVGLNRMTLLHLAEKEAGRTLFRRWAYDADGKAAMFEVGGCSEGFERLASDLAHLERRVTVGRSVWRIYPARAALEQSAALIRNTPEITRCDDSACTRCRDGIAGGPFL